MWVAQGRNGSDIPIQRAELKSVEEHLDDLEFDGWL